MCRKEHERIGYRRLGESLPCPDLGAPKSVFFSFNAVSWILSAEIFFYALFPLLVLRIREDLGVETPRNGPHMRITVLPAGAFRTSALTQNFAASRVCPGGVTATWLPESFREARLRGGDPQNWPLMPAPVAPILFCLNTEFTTNVIGPPRMAKGGTMAPGATWVRGAVLPKRLDNGRCFVFGGLGRFDTLSM
jgi:hypothetical protein